MHIEKDNIPQLKQFALTMSWSIPLFFSLLLPWIFDYSWQYWPLFISLYLLTLWLLKPEWIYYPFLTWMKLAGVIGWINTRIILALCFYLLIFPIGVVMRTIGKLDYDDRRNKSKFTNYKLTKSKIHKKDLEFPF